MLQIEEVKPGTFAVVERNGQFREVIGTFSGKNADVKASKLLVEIENEIGALLEMAKSEPKLTSK